MNQSLSEQQDVLEASLKAAQYLANLSTQQDIWSESGKMLVGFFGADLCAFGERGAGGEIIGFHWTFSDRFPDPGDLEELTREAISEVLVSGYLATRILSAPEPVAAVFSPVTLESRVIAVMVAGHLMSEPLPNALVNVYLAVAGMIGTTAARLVSEREIRLHRRHPEQSAAERTAELTEANEQQRGSVSSAIKVVEDVTEHRQVEQLNSHLASIVESSDDAIISKTLDGIITSWNIGAEKIYGYSAAEAVGNHISMIMPEGQPDEFQSLADRIICGRSVTHYETLRVRKDGRNIHVSLRLSPIRGVKGAIQGVATIARDITESKLAEDELRRLNAYNRSLIEASLDPLVTIGPDGRITDVNAATEEVTGLRRGKLVGSDFCDYFTDPGAARAGYLRVFTDGSVRDYPLEILHRDGHATPVLYNATVYRDEAGTIIGVFAAARDITERKRTEDELRRLNAYNRSLIEASLDPLVTIGPDGRITDANAATEEVTGRRRVELTGTDFCDYFTSPEAARAGYRQVFRDGSVRDYPLEILHRDGHVTPVLYNATVYRDEEGIIIGVFAAARDITERIQAETERLEMERRLLHSQKLESLGVLAGGIAHDFNNLLAVILGDLDLALMTLPHDSPVRTRIDKALQASQRAASLIRQMLAYAGKGHFVLREIDLNAIVRGNADLFRTSVARNIALEIVAAPGLPLVKADQGQVQQVIMNLIINASEAIGACSGVIALRTGIMECDDECLGRSRVDVKPGGGMFVFLEVSDTGCGMDEETRLRLFEPFFTTKFTGRGLGMSAVLGIVRAHKGAILLESEKGRGTTFRVLFPVSTEVLEAPREIHEAASPSKLPAARGGTVLVVDDEDLVRELCLVSIRSLGFQVIGAGDGYEAVKVFREHADEIAFVVLDMTMPKMNGAHAFYELRKIRPDVRVIISSGYSEEEVSGRFDGEMPTGFIHKPFRIEVLQSTIAQVLNRKN